MATYGVKAANPNQRANNSSVYRWVVANPPMCAPHTAGRNHPFSPPLLFTLWDVGRGIEDDAKGRRRLDSAAAGALVLNPNGVDCVPAELNR
ncbi:MAG TPA: hypothetical protein VGG97_11145 [Bryobacteraceae bacterium]